MFDLHVHAAPDVVPRRGDDVATVAWYEQAGFRGCVLKGHWDPTAGRALAAAAGRRITVHGGLVLNRPAGGINAAAVAAALATGARVIWLPTVDAHTQPAAGLPRPFDGDDRLGPAETYAVPPVDPRAEEPLRRILRLVADSDAVLATGHVSAAECAWAVAEARRAGVRRILLTHPAYTVPAMSAATARELAERGARVEVCAYQLLHQPGCDATTLAAFVRAVGVEHCVLSSDAGQVDSPSPPDALHVLVDALAREGIDRGALVAAASDRPEALVCR